ncbi:hypothetical protein FACS1894201_02780 [Bacteroidia bacterium]|nr:hypothetical protein FACS1894201_02780 [Bacteroidia bacterium]
MQHKTLNNILSDYAQMDVDSLVEFKDFAEQYPYCQSLHILYLLNLRRLEEDTFPAALASTAIRVYDRTLLKSHVEKVDTLFAHPEPAVPKTVKATTPLKNLSQKTISDLLHIPKTTVRSTPLPRSSGETRDLNVEVTPLSRSADRTRDVKISQIQVPPSARTDEEYLELMRQEALAKINQRLTALRQANGPTSPLVQTPTPIAETQPLQPKTNKLKTSGELIDTIIETNPKISKIETEKTGKSLSTWKTKEAMSLREDYALVSETLAKVYLSQGATKKAIEVYKNLSKKFPERKAYFTKIIKSVDANA